MDTHNLEEGTTEFSRDFDTASRATYLRWYNAFWKLQRYFSVGLERQLAESMARINEYVYGCIDAQKDLDGDHLIARFLKVEYRFKKAPLVCLFFFFPIYCSYFSTVADNAAFFLFIWWFHAG